MQKDEFVNILKKHLQKNNSETQNEGDLIHEAVAEYIYLLMQKGNVPQQHLDQIEEDLKEEALEIYRKITYGHPSLKDYRQSKKSKIQRSS